MNHTKLELVILSLVIKIFYNFNINSFNFNVEVGGQTIISKSVTLRTLVAFFEIVIPDKKNTWSSFSVGYLAPHTSGPRDVPRCGALSLLQKDAALQGGFS